MMTLYVTNRPTDEPTNRLFLKESDSPQGTTTTQSVKMKTGDRGPMTGCQLGRSPVFRPRSIFKGVFTNLGHATDDENLLRRSAVYCQRSSPHCTGRPFHSAEALSASHSRAMRSPTSGGQGFSN